MSTPEHDDDAEDGVTTRHVWIAGGGVAVALVVVAALAVGLSGGGDQDASATPSARSTSTSTLVPAPSPSAPAPGASSATPAPSASVPSPTASPTRAGPVWSGTLTVRGSRTRRDLDAVPPRSSTRGGEPDIRGDWLKTVLEAENDAQLAVLPAGRRPTAATCRDAAAAAGSDETEPLQEGDVVCVVTAAGRVAALTTTHSTQTSTAPELAFKAVLW